jgi:class 3 adenylate cyclase/pimeloyl-ACP methyl ester carboxylesterase
VCRAPDGGQPPQQQKTRNTVGVQPATRYARSGDINVAYTIAGAGPFDVIFVPGFVSNVELDWSDPLRAAFLNRLASFSRLIMLDKRGTGLSDRVSGVPDLETRMDDIRAVMDAAGSERAALFGLADGGSLAILFAATYPERIGSLVLYATLPRYVRSPDFPWAPTREKAEREITELERRWGTPELASEWLEGNDGAAAEDLAALMRRSASPGAAAALARMNLDIDVRHLLGAVRVPTLVLHRTGHRIDVRGGRFLAQQIPGARFIELEGSEGLPYLGDSERLLGEIERFLIDLWESGGWDEAEPDRILATVLFSDIVGSSEKAASLGDRAWRELLERHHELVRRHLVRHRGREVDAVGDGFLASFDGPARAIRCGCAIAESVPELGLEVRVGLHTGECELLDGKVAGIAVHTGARVASLAGPGEVLVSSTVKDLVAGSGIAFEDRGTHELKGIPGEWRLYGVAPRDRSQEAKANST